MSSKTTIAVLRHYKTIPGKGYKDIVTEYVKEGSDSHTFLERMELKRLSQKTNRSIDLRGKVSDPCQAFKHEGRTHWMDNRSKKLFFDLMKEYDNEYTVGVFEEVTQSEFTFKAMAQAQEDMERQQQQIRDLLAESDDVDQTLLDTLPLDLIYFGHLKKRREPRLTYVMEIEIQFNDGSTVKGKTKDISRSGIRANLTACPAVEPGESVLIYFSAFSQDYLFSESGYSYEIVNLSKINEKQLLSLKKSDIEEHPKLEKFLTEFIEKNKSRYKVDITDDLVAIYSDAYERFYFPYITHIHFLVSEDEKHPKVEYISGSPRSQYIIDKWHKDTESIDLTHFLTERRINYLINRAKKHPQVMMVMYTFSCKFKGKKTFFTAAESDFINDTQKSNFLGIAVEQSDFKAYKIIFSKSVPLSHFKYQDRLAELSSKDEEESTKLQAYLEEIDYIGSIVEVTKQVYSASTTNFTATSSPESVLTPFISQVTEINHSNFVNTAQKKLRTEQRYRHRSPVIVEAEGQKVSGQMIDFSIKGIKVKLDQPLDVKIDTPIKLSLSKLQKMTKDVDLNGLGYIVTSQAEAGKMLRLKREDSAPNYDKVSDFFSRLIKSNPDKLKHCYDNLKQDAETSLLNDMICEGLPCLPLFIGRDDRNKPIVTKIAASKDLHPLIWFFQLSNGEYDYTPIANDELLRACVRDGVRKHELNSAPFEVEVFVIKAFNDIIGRDALKFVDSVNNSKSEVRAFIHEAIKADDYRFLKVSVSEIDEFDEADLAAELDHIRANSRHQAKSLKQELSTITALAEVFDVTDEIKLREGLK